MLNTPYDILELFEVAFDKEKTVSAIIQVDCSGSTRYAEGTKNGVMWHIEADSFNTIAVDPEQLRMAYAHLGEHLLPSFYKEAKIRAESLGYTGHDLEKRVLVVMEPVLEAMEFNMWTASSKGWLAHPLYRDLYGNTRLFVADFTMEQAVAWTKFGRPGGWSSGQLMSMLVALQIDDKYLDDSSAQRWLDMHTVEARPISKRVLDTAFAPDKMGSRSVQVDYLSAVEAWSSWWTMQPLLNMNATPLAVMENFSQPKKEALVEGWYLSVAQSQKAASNCLRNIEYLQNGLIEPSIWSRLGNALTTVIQSHTTLVWQDKEAQAWMLHQALPEDGLDHLLAMQDNRVHDYVTIAKQLDPQCSIGALHMAWLQMQDQEEEPVFDTPGLFEDTSVPLIGL